MRNFFQRKPHVPEVSPQWTPPEPAILVIFGVTGDLARHMLMPALYHLVKDGLLHEHTAIVGVSRHQLTKTELLKRVELCVMEKDKVCDAKVLDEFRRRLHMAHVNAVDEADYDGLKASLDAIENKHGVCMNRLFYLAIPPQVYEPVIENLGKHQLNKGCQHHEAVSRLLVEKPFGYDLASAKELIRHTARFFSEQQVFRIDHYLAKETAQNILVFRAQNPLFSSVWNNRHVTSVDLTFYEELDVEGRGSFYDNTGALRDVVQNHLMQLLALTTMELPSSILNEAHVHGVKRALLGAIPSLDVVRQPPLRGQYEGYQQEVGNIGSTTETYVRLQLEVRNNRWRGVPITLSAGKALARTQKQVSLTFADNHAAGALNRLTFRISPNEGIDIELTAKQPGFEEKTQVVLMDFSYHDAFGSTSHPNAYERVLIDAIRGDHALFASSGEVLESWRILQPALTSWGMSDEKPVLYAKGSDGPA